MTKKELGLMRGALHLIQTRVRASTCSALIITPFDGNSDEKAALVDSIIKQFRIFVLARPEIEATTLEIAREMGLDDGYFWWPLEKVEPNRIRAIELFLKKHEQ